MMNGRKKQGRDIVSYNNITTQDCEDWVEKDEGDRF